MSCFQGDKSKRALLVFCVLVLIQLGLVIGLLVLGVKGKEEIGLKTGAGVPYYVGALLVGSVFAVPVIQIITVIILSHWEDDHCIISCFGVSACIINFFGILVCIIGMIFVISFGIANCKKDTDEDYTDSGFCSYRTNVDSNYAIAVSALVLILFMLMSTCFFFYVFSKYSDDLGSGKQTALASPASVVPSDYGRDRIQARAVTQQGPGPPVYPAPSAPPLNPQNQCTSDFVNPPPNIGWQPRVGSEEPPPSYESVMGYSTTNQNLHSSQASRQPGTASGLPASRPQLSLAEQMTRDTQRRMQEDRRRRQDADRQRRMGVPGNRIVRKFIGKFGF